MSLALEDWQPLNAPGSSAGASSSSSSNIDIGSLKQQLSSSPYLLPAHGQSGCVADFDLWVQAGNPFTVKARTRAVGGEPKPPLANPMLARMQLYSSAARAPTGFQCGVADCWFRASCLRDAMRVVWHGLLAGCTLQSYPHPPLFCFTLLYTHVICCTLHMCRPVSDASCSWPACTNL
jgi:hypothetical protein